MKKDSLKFKQIRPDTDIIITDELAALSNFAISESKKKISESFQEMTNVLDELLTNKNQTK